MEEKKERFDKFISTSLLALLFIACICAVVESIFDPQSAIAHYQNIDNQVRTTVMTTVANIMLIAGALDILLGITWVVGKIYFAIKKRKAKK